MPCFARPRSLPCQTRPRLAALRRAAPCHTEPRSLPWRAVRCHASPGQAESGLIAFLPRLCLAVNPAQMLKYLSLPSSLPCRALPSIALHRLTSPDQASHVPRLAKSCHALPRPATPCLNKPRSSPNPASPRLAAQRRAMPDHAVVILSSICRTILHQAP